MKIKIDEKLICIPPHLSTTWDQVSSIHAEEESHPNHHLLTIHLKDGSEVQINGLDSSVVDIAFSAHMKHLENNPAQDESHGKTFGGVIQQLTGLSPEQLAGVPIRLGLGLPGGMDGLEMAMQHNQEQNNAPDVPSEMLEKIMMLAKTMIGSDISAFPKPEPHCNCLHCQVARAIHQLPKEAQQEEDVSDEDLSFRDWEIVQKNEQLFEVTSPLDPKEHYSVFLGTPVGCTCGIEGCEHLKAVLYS